MANLALIFVTGLTAGGLSCLAVQGGMLASALASPSENDMTDKLKSNGKKPVPTRFATPIILFLGSKLVAYTILGLALGWLGSVLQLTPIMRAILQIVIGIFMVGTALRLLNVHPIFRYFAIEPPKAVTRYIRRKTKSSNDNWLAPTFLGALTVLIPCAITQAMMALAIASGSPISGALIMFAFVLGTTPVFFTLAYLATKLGSKMQDKFWKFAGVAVLLLGLFAIDGGLNLMGSPLSSAAVKQAWAENIQQAREDSLAAQSQGEPQVAASDNNELAMSITDSAYSPAVMLAKAGQPIKLKITTTNVQGCGRALVIPSLGMQKLLDSSGTQTIELPAQKPGRIRLTCTMGMYNAQINVQ